MRLLRLVLQALREGGLTVNREKSKIGVHEVTFLGHIINEHKVKMTEDTKQAILSFPEPKSKKQIQAFLGLANWNRRFIPQLSELTRDLEKLITKNKKFKWGEEEEKAMQQIKNAFKEAQELFLMKKDARLGIESDASLIGLGCRLFQINEG